MMRPMPPRCCFAPAIAVAAVTALAAPAARAAGADFSACFGGAPEAVVSGAKRLGTLQINERYLFWPGYRMELATRVAGAGVGPGDANVWDASEAFVVTGVNELLARD